MINSLNRWYILFVTGGKESGLCEYLNKQASWKAFVPKIETPIKKDGLLTFPKKVLFPSYVFIETTMDPAAFQDNIKAIKQRKMGIVRELKYDKGDIPSLRDEEKAYLESLLDEKKVINKSVGFIENDRVVVVDGPLVGHESYIIKIDRHKRKAMIRMKILSNEIEVSVPLEIIKKI
ncbi:MAG: antiterminator LoaP [Longicatena sp.]